MFQQPHSAENEAAVGLRNLSATDSSELAQHLQGLPGAQFLFEALPEES